MKDLKILLEYFRENKIGAIIVLVATLVGAALGVMAYYNGWLG